MAESPVLTSFVHRIHKWLDRRSRDAVTVGLLPVAVTNAHSIRGVPLLISDRTATDISPNIPHWHCLHFAVNKYCQKEVNNYNVICTTHWQNCLFIYYLGLPHAIQAIRQTLYRRTLVSPISVYFDFWWPHKNSFYSFLIKQAVRAAYITYIY